METEPTKELRRSIDMGTLVLLVGLSPLFIFGGLAALLLCLQLPVIYYAEFHSIQGKLASQPGVTITSSWKHEDLSLEDCGFTLQVRDCPPVQVDFYEGEDWEGQFRRIDGLAVREGFDSVKLIRVERLAEMGMPVRNLPDLLAHLEGVLAVADGMEPNASRPLPEGRWVALRYPPGNGWY